MRKESWFNSEAARYIHHYETKAAKLLLEAGADASLVDAQGRTPESMARERGKDGLELANMLRDIVFSRDEDDDLKDFIPVPPLKTSKKKKPVKSKTL